MEKELNEAAESGFQVREVMGGETAFGGSEVVVVMSRASGIDEPAGSGIGSSPRRKPRRCRRSCRRRPKRGSSIGARRCSTSAFGGEEVVCILERDGAAAKDSIDYRLVATSKTATLQTELAQVGAAGYQVVGMTVGKTALGGSELVAITRRVKEQ